ncbi:MAG: Hsp20/alpha crystallin family protein [Firmicutes bacterium]|nr:Hsp20/alpha crystallin family protein [Bacillota bacterium]
MKDIVRRNSGNEMDRIRSGIDQVFADAFFRNWPVGGQSSYPQVDLFNTEGSLVALVNLPGAEITDVEVTTNNDTLTITGEVKLQSIEGDLLWQERTAGNFYRSFKLPVPIKADQVEASFKSGVLKIEMPKIDELKSRTIKIKEG